MTPMNMLIAKKSNPVSFNVALSANGSSATCTSSYAGTSAANGINGNRNGDYPNMCSSDSPTLPWVLDVDFGVTRTVTLINAVFYQGDGQTTPTLSTTYGGGSAVFQVSAFKIYYRDAGDASWIQKESITSNDKVWRQFDYSASTFTTRKMRVEVITTADSYARFQEFEVFGY